MAKVSFDLYPQHGGEPPAQRLVGVGGLGEAIRQDFFRHPPKQIALPLRDPPERVDELAQAAAPAPRRLRGPPIPAIDDPSRFTRVSADRFAAARAARALWLGAGRGDAPTSTPLEAATHFGAGSVVGAAVVWAGWLEGGGRAGCRLQHTTPGSVKRRGHREDSLGEPVPVRGVVAEWSAAALHYRCCVLSGARGWPGGMMGGPASRAAARQAARVTAGGRRSGRMVRSGRGVLAGGVTREGAVGRRRAARSRAALRAAAGGWLAQAPGRWAGVATTAVGDSGLTYGLPPPASHSL